MQGSYKYYLSLTLLLLLLGIQANAQYNNSWINYSTLHQYFKFPIVATGVYRLDSLTLANAGFPTGSISPQKLQLFARGNEIPLHIRGTQDGVLNATDYIEFYATKNSGDLDTALYLAKGGNPYYSLFNDTINYYLTWSITAQNGVRYAVDTTRNHSSYTPIAYWNKLSINSYTNSYSYGKALAGATDYGYSADEGWMSYTDKTTTNGFQAYINTPNIVPNAPISIQTFYTSGSNSSTSTVDNQLQLSLNGTLLKDSTFDGYQYFNYTLPQTTAILTANNLLTFKSVNLGQDNSGRAYIAYFNINYPAYTIANNRANYSFYLPATTTPIQRIDIAQQAGNMANTRLLNTTNYKLTVPDTANGNCIALLGTTPNLQNNYVVYNLDSTLKIKSISKINGTGYFTNYTPALTNNEVIFLTHANLTTTAQQYAMYRTSKGKQSTVVHANELYDQFAYGVNNSPVALHNFVQYAKQVAPSNNYLFIIGKGINSSYARYGANYALNLVPTFGEPPSDILLVASIGYTNLAPLMHVGRLATASATEINYYYNKVVEYETNTQSNKFTDDGEWMKQALHFAGGNSAAQANIFKGYLDDFKDTLEAPLYGGHVSTYSKSTSLPIGQVTEVIRQQINSGVSIMTFLAHASGAGFDQDIGFPNTYTNTNGKYPLIIGNSCFVGDIHASNTYSFSQSWILDPKGAIGFIAEPSLGFPDVLAQYSQELYNQLSRKNYGGSIGAHMSATIGLLTTTNNDLLRNSCVGMTLHGDPTIAINSPQKPDLALRNSATTISPSVVTTANDSFTIKLTAFNFGKAVTTPVSVTIEHFYPGSTLADTVYSTTLANGLNYTASLQFSIKLNATKAVGQNHFVIKIDPYDAIFPEQTETNNTIAIDVTILNSDVYPVYPANYAIVPTNKLVLKAATGLPLEPTANYKMECDTTDLFNSPLLQTTTITSAGGVMEWNINNATLIDTTVYFWRVAKVTGNALKWKEQSFEYIAQKTGYSQAHFFQFEDDNYQYIDAVRAQRKYKFTTKPVNLKCEVRGGSAFENKFQLDTEIKEYNGCGFSTQIHVAIIDTNGLQPWGTSYNGLNASNNFGNYNNNGGCRPRVEYDFSFITTDTVQMAGLQNLLQTVPTGYYILLYTYINGNFNAWKPALKNYVNSLGGTFVGSLPDDYPYIFFVQKGNLASAQQVIPASSKFEKLVFNQPLYNDWYYGNITSTTIGPVSKWHSLHWNATSIDAVTTNDNITLKLFAKQPNGQEVQVMRTFTTADKNVVLTDSINALQYPTLTMRAYSKDSITRTPSQMNYWRIYYDPLPEGVINPKQAYSYTNSTTQEGDSIKLQVAFTNVTNVPMDSVLVRYWWQDASGKTFATGNNIPQTFTYTRADKLPANASINLTASIPTLGKQGSNTLWLEANPSNDQAEQFHFNNYLALPFKITKDNQNPLLDVTFDGQHILNGDIVAPSPLIELQVKDENKFLLLNDTSNVTLSLKRPNGNTYQRLYYSNAGNYTMQFVPAQSTTNKARVLLQANGLTDGVYTLSAQSTDRSNNRSGTSNYEVSFEVVNKSSLTNVVNYPNPFSTNTKFVYTLTGASIPEVFKIQILTVTGKLVRELTMNELGAIHTGRNISATGWDGTDMYGDQLANGLYLYHIIAKVNGQDIELRETIADNYFKKGWGKMYLLR